MVKYVKVIYICFFFFLFFVFGFYISKIQISHATNLITGSTTKGTLLEEADPIQFKIKNIIGSQVWNLGALKLDGQRNKIILNLINIKHEVDLDDFSGSTEANMGILKAGIIGNPDTNKRNFVFIKAKSKQINVELKLAYEAGMGAITTSTVKSNIPPTDYNFKLRHAVSGETWEYSGTAQSQKKSKIDTYTENLPQTGQNTCYDMDGDEIECPPEGEFLYGQDANYQDGQPRSYTKLDEDGSELSDEATDWAMVRDNVTGLIWEVKTDDGMIHDKNDKYDFDTAQNKFISALNNLNFGCYSDWRMPTVKELSTLVHAGKYGPAINTNYFPNTKSDFYRSSSLTSSSWIVSFSDGYIGRNSKSYDYFVRAVRGEIDTKFNFIDNGDGTVTDTETKLMWQKSRSNNMMQWYEALSYCSNLNLAGYSDWRLPNRNELLSIVNYDSYGPSINTYYFPDTHSSNYWSSSSRVVHAALSHLTHFAWYVGFGYGNVSVEDKSDDCYVRAVRSIAAGNSTFSVANYNISPTDHTFKQEHAVIKEQLEYQNAAQSQKKSNYDTYTEPVTGIEFVWIPGGCYMMGMTKSEKNSLKQEIIQLIGKENYKKQSNEINKYLNMHSMHEVCVDGFWMGKYEVTQGQWEKIMGNNPSNFDKVGNYPLERVSWNDCQEFIEKLNRRNDVKYRLPTEAEWEYAARAGTKTARYWGDGIDCSQANYGNGRSDVCEGKNPGRTTKVGSYAANPWGLYDMLGNVGEWCADWYDSDAYRQHSRNNPIYDSGGSNRVIRGSGWHSKLSFVRCALRFSDDPGDLEDSLGFRLCYSP